MNKKELVWRLHRRAKAYAQCPSNLMGIEDEIFAHCFDEVVEIFGTLVDSLLEETEVKDKQTRRKYSSLEKAIREALRRFAGDESQKTNLIDTMIEQGLDDFSL